MTSLVNVSDMSNKLLKIFFVVLLTMVLFTVLRCSNILRQMSYIFDNFKYLIFELHENENIKKEKVAIVTSSDDVVGIWKSEGIEFKNRYEAIIDEESITVYKYVDNIKMVYWIGTFEVNNINLKIVSKNYTEISKYITTASSAKDKEFIYEKRILRFISQFDDDRIEVSLKKYIPYNDRLRVIKYPGKRDKISLSYDNTEILFNGMEIPYPSYFDIEEENSFREVPDNHPYNITDTMIEKKHLILSPSSKNAHAELFIGEYENAKIKDIYELYDLMQYGSENINIDKNEILTYAFNAKNNSIMIVFITKYYDKEMDIDIYGIAFENWILDKKTDEVIVVGVAYTYDDITTYDYIGNYEKMLDYIYKNWDL